MKSDKNIVRDILKAQGLPHDTEPTPEAIRVLRDYGTQQWATGFKEARYEINEWGE